MIGVYWPWRQIFTPQNVQYMLVIELGHGLEMASDTRLQVPSTHWRVPLILRTGISLQVLSTGAGVHLLAKKLGGHPLQVPLNYLPTQLGMAFLLSRH
jgi:hypothetical protein